VIENNGVGLSGNEHKRVIKVQSTINTGTLPIYQKPISSVSLRLHYEIEIINGSVVIIIPTCP
jgi:hypothetical protein